MLTVFPHFQQPEAEDFKCTELGIIVDSETTEALKIVTNEYMDFLLNIFCIVLDCGLRLDGTCCSMDELLDYSNYPLKTWDHKLK